MSENKWLAEQFQAQRPQLRAVAYRMLGSLADADDVVQEAWLRLSRSGSGVDNLGGWLTTVVGRLCLDVLRSRKARPADSLDDRLPEMIVALGDGGPSAEDEAVLADSVGLALLVVLDTLTPPERLAFVLHDMFDLPFEEIAPMVGRSPEAARKLASRARHRVRGSAPVPDRDLARQREVVDAFFAAAHRGDFDALVGVLDPGVVLRADTGPGRPLLVAQGPGAVTERALMFATPGRAVHRALVNGAAGAVIAIGTRPVAVMAFTVTGGKITEIDAVTDHERLRRLGLAIPQ